jgi:hypothetical protein
LTPAESRRRLALVQTARDRLPELPTAALYRVNALLERALATPEVDPATYEELESILRNHRQGARVRSPRA